MDEIEQLISNLSCNWNFAGQEKPINELAIQRLVEIGEPAVPYLIDGFKRTLRKEVKRLAVSYEDIEGSDKRTKSGILLVLKQMGLSVVSTYSDLCLEGMNEVPSGADAILDIKKRIRHRAFGELRGFIQKSTSIEEIRQIVDELQVFLFGSKKRSHLYPPDVKMNFGKLKMDAAIRKNYLAKRKNELAQDKGILLDDKPKPPKKGMYQQIRRGIRNG